MQKILSSVLLALMACQLQAQNDSVSKNNYSFSLINGVSLTKGERMTGSEKLKTAASVFHGLNFEYTRNLTQDFSLSGIAGFGFLPLNYKVADKDSFSGTGFMGYFERLQYQTFANLALSAGYRKQISDKYALKVHAGLGMKYLPTSYFEIGYYGTSGSDYYLKGQFMGQVNPYITAGAGIIRSLRNMDELSLRLSYEQCFKEVYKGNYYLQNGTSTGRFYNTGSNVNLALTYTFTGIAKKKKIETLKETEFQDRRSAKKQYRKEIRYIDPKSMFITATAGLGFGINRVKDPGNTLSNGAALSILPRVTFEKGIARNYFAEAGFNTLEYWSAEKVKSFFSSASSAFTVYQLSVGGGKRLIAKNNYNIITLHAGLSFGATNIIKGNNTSGSFAIGTVDNSGQVVNYFSAYSEEYGIHRFITSAYLGASKDFRLTRHFYLALSYRYQQGFYTVYEQKVKYTTSMMQDALVHAATIKIDGSSHVFEFGFKIKL